MVDFFEKITGGIDKGIKTISSKGKEIFETTKLKGEIKEVETSVQTRFQGLGKKVFEMLNRGALSEDELRVDCKEITSLFKKITELENLIKQVELETAKMRHGSDIIICQNCKGQNKSDAKFCMNCGSPLAIEAPGEINACPTCNAPIKENAKFCIKCGGKIG